MGSRKKGNGLHGITNLDPAMGLCKQEIPVIPLMKAD